MDISDKLNKEFAGQDREMLRLGQYIIEDYKQAALHYARVENSIAVLSDLRIGVSHIYYGGFAKTLGLKPCVDGERICSIWERDLLALIHPDDLGDKYLRELRFLQFIRRTPRARRSRFILASKLRMHDARGGYHAVLHRLSYVAAPDGSGICLALCLYNPLSLDFAGAAVIVDTSDGTMSGLDDRCSVPLLSVRERQVLRLIDGGMTSKSIAESLSISPNTVNRHRQSILAKLRVRNAVEACRAAHDLGLL